MSPTHHLLALMLGWDVEAYSPHLGGDACFDSCLSLRHGAQPLCCLDNQAAMKMSQLKRGGGRLRVITVQRSSRMRPDVGTEAVCGGSP